MSLLKKMSLFSECYGDSTLEYIALITSFVFLGFSLLGMYPKALPHKQQQVKSHLSELIALSAQSKRQISWNGSINHFPRERLLHLVVMTNCKGRLHASMNLIIKPELKFKDVKVKNIHHYNSHTFLYHTTLCSPSNLTFLLSLIFTPLTLWSGQSCIFLSIHVLYHFEV